MLDDRVRVLGRDEEDTLEARSNLASALWDADRQDEAIAVEEEIVSECARILGDEHTETLTARRDLASSLRQAGHAEQAHANADRARRRPRAPVRRRPPGDAGGAEDPRRRLTAARGSPRPDGAAGVHEGHRHDRQHQRTRPSNTGKKKVACIKKVTREAS